MTDRKKVAVTRLLPEAGMEILEKEVDAEVWEDDSPVPPEKLLQMVEGVEGIVCLLSDPMDVGVMDAAGDSLKVISTMAVGYDNIDVAEASRRGIYVGHTPGVLTEATADLTWALILSVGRRIVEGDRMTRQGRFNGWGPTMLVGADFIHRTLGIVGMGRIGKAVARRAKGFDMEVIYHNRNRVPEDEEKELNARFVTMDEMAESADFISLHCPLNEQSKHLIGRETIEKMKPSSYLINVARGPVVDEAALVEALKQNRIAGAAFDVYENEPKLSPGLAELDNVVLAPHIGSASIATRNRMAAMTVENLLAGLKGEKPPWCVNPEMKKGG